MATSSFIRKIIVTGKEATDMIINAITSDTDIKKTVSNCKNINSKKQGLAEFLNKHCEAVSKDEEEEIKAMNINFNDEQK